MIRMIRPANQNDLQEILDIYNDAILNTTAIYQYKPYTLEDRKVWYEKKLKEGFPIIVYEKNNIIIGFATYGPFRPFPAYKYTIEHSIYVHKDYQRKNIGSSLLKKLLEIANFQGYATMIAVIDNSNEGSKIMHEKLGFKHAGFFEKVGFKFEKWLDLDFYQLELNGPKEPVEDNYKDSY